eukprot:1158827-Pelagomonas_calceolata.AAC.6
MASLLGSHAFPAMLAASHDIGPPPPCCLEQKGEGYIAVPAYKGSLAEAKWCLPCSQHHRSCKKTPAVLVSP